MDTPFPHSKFVTGKNFIGRKADCILLGNLISQGEHVSIYEPPKSGKTSLIQQTLFNLRFTGKQFTVGEMSCLNIRDAETFICRLGSTVIKMAAASPEDYAAIALKYLGGTHLVFDPSAFEERGEILSTSWELSADDILEVYRLPFRIAMDKGEKMILTIDEFQNISFTENDGDLLLRQLSSVIREMADAGNRNFCFIFCGSMVNAMKEIFERNLLLRRRVERVRLTPVGEKEIADHVHKGFLSSGKSVKIELLEGACKLLKHNLWYINHFAYLADSMARGYIMEPTLVDALECLIAIHQPRFEAIMNSLTTHQVNLLKATVAGVTRFSASEIIRRYQLNSSANVKRIKDALKKKEVLTFNEDDIPSFIDPLFEYWIRKYFFELAE